MSFKIGEKVKIISENRTGVIKKVINEYGTRYLVLKDALVKGEKSRYSSVFENNLAHIDPAQYALNEGFCEYMEAAGYNSKGEKMIRPQSKDDEIKKIIFSGCKTIVLWADGTKTIVSKSKNDDWDPVMAVCAAYVKKNLGSMNQIRKLIDKKSNIEKYTDETLEKVLEKIQKAQEEM